MLSTNRDSMQHGSDPLTRLRQMAGGLDLIAAGAVLLTFIGLEWLSFIHEHKGVPVTPWNPGLGVVFAWLVMKGAAYGLVLFIGVIIAEIFVLKTELSWPVILAMAVVISVSYAVVASITRRYLRLDAGLHHVGDVLMLLAAGAIGALVSTVLLSLLLLATQELRLSDLPQSSLPLLVGDTIGIAVVTPLVLRLSLRWTDITWQGLKQLVPEILVYTLVTGFALWMIMGNVAPNDYKFLSLLFLPVVAAAVRHGIDGSCLALAAAQLALVVLLHRYGYDARTFTEFQVVMLILTMTGLLVGVVVSEREQASLAVRSAETRLKDMQLEAARASRMNLISGMASALAHEINQPMTAARALARSVQEILKTPDSDKARVDNNLTNLVANIDHAAGVIRRMREFLRRGQPHLSTLEVASTLDDALVLVRPEAAKSHIRVDLDVGKEIPAIFADRIQLQQVVLNLVRNAIEAIVDAHRTDGRIQVSARLSDQGSAVEIAVVDNGIGVPEDRVLFEPLSSSKAEGLGLGLSISASIIQAHGGRIWLHSRESGATELRFSLPVQSKDTA